MFGYRINRISLLGAMAGALLALASPLHDARAVEGAATDPNGLPPEPTSKPGIQHELDKFPWSFALDGSVRSAYVTDFGQKVGEGGPVIQTGLRADRGDKYSLKLWGNLNTADSIGNQANLTFRRNNLRLFELNGHDVVGYAGADFLAIPKERGGNDLVFVAGADWKGGKYDVGAYLKYVTGLGERDGGVLAHARVSRTYPLWEETLADDDPRANLGGGMKASATWHVDTAIGSEYFGDDTGLYHVTPGATIQLKDGNTTYFLGGDVQLGFGDKGNVASVWAGAAHQLGKP